MKMNTVFQCCSKITVSIADMTLTVKAVTLPFSVFAYK